MKTEEIKNQKHPSHLLSLDAVASNIYPECVKNKYHLQGKGRPLALSAGHELSLVTEA